MQCQKEIDTSNKLTKVDKALKKLNKEMAFSSKRLQKRRALFQPEASNSSISHLDSALATIDKIRESTSKKRKRRKVVAKNAVILDHQLHPLSEIPDLAFSTIDHEKQSQFTLMPMSELMLPVSRAKNKSNFIR